MAGHPVAGLHLECLSVNIEEEEEEEN